MSSYNDSRISGLPVKKEYAILHLEQSRQPAIVREPLILRPQSQTYSTNGDNCVRFVMPQQNADYRQSLLTADVTITTTGGTYKRLCQNAASMINRVRYFCGAYEETQEYYNRAQNLVINTSVDGDVIATIGQDLLGYGTQFDRNTAGAVAGETTGIALNIGIFAQGVFPGTVLGAGSDFNVEIYLENPLYFVETDGTNPVVSITNLKWNYHWVHSFDGSYEAAVKRDISSGMVKFGYESYAVYQNPVINTSNDIQIPWRGNALSMIQNVLVDQSSIANPAVNDKFITWPKTLSNAASVISYQIQLKDGVWIPVEPFDTTQFAERAFWEYLNSQGLWSIDALNQWPAPIDIDSFNNDQFVMVNNLNSIPVEAYARDFYFNSLSTFKQSQNTVFRLTLNAVPPLQTVLYSFICFGVLLDVSSQGVLRRHL